MLSTTTPWCSGQSSLHRPMCALTTLPPYRKGISPLGLTQTLYRAYGAMMGSAVMCSRNLPVLVNFPKLIANVSIIALREAGREPGAQRQKRVAADRRSQVGEGFADVIHAVALDMESQSGSPSTVGS